MFLWNYWQLAFLANTLIGALIASTVWSFLALHAMPPIMQQFDHHATLFQTLKGKETWILLVISFGSFLEGAE